jgi:hypothetical protein
MKQAPAESDDIPLDDSAERQFLTPIRTDVL